MKYEKFTKQKLKLKYIFEQQWKKIIYALASIDSKNKKNRSELQGN